MRKSSIADAMIVALFAMVSCLLMCLLRRCASIDCFSDKVVSRYPLWGLRKKHSDMIAFGLFRRT